MNILFPSFVEGTSPNHHISKASSEQSRAGKSFANVIKTVGSSFPLRYVGSKSCSLPGFVLGKINQLVHFIVQPGKALPPIGCEGYQWSLKKLPMEAVKHYVRLQSPLAASYANRWAWLDASGYKLINSKDVPVPLPKGVIAKDTCFFNPRNGLKIAFFQNKEETVVAFGAIFSGNVELSNKRQQSRLVLRQHLYAFSAVFGGMPSSYRQADQIIRNLKDSGYFEGKKVILTGQCLGGGIASYAGLRNKIPTLCANTLLMGAGLQKRVGIETLREAKKYVTHVSTRGDYISNNRIFHIFDRCLSFIGVRTPGNFGNRFYIPSAFKSPAQNHAEIQSCALAYMGYSRHARPWKEGLDQQGKPLRINPQDIQI